MPKPKQILATEYSRNRYITGFWATLTSKARCIAAQDETRDMDMGAYLAIGGKCVQDFFVYLWFYEGTL